MIGVMQIELQFWNPWIYLKIIGPRDEILHLGKNTTCATCPSHSLSLKGVINGILHRELLRYFKDQLRIGSVILLKLVSIYPLDYAEVIFACPRMGNLQ